MGEVFLAQHQLLKRPCAIKLIRPELTVKPRVLARFELEVTATARLSHWNTVEVYDYGRSERGTFFYVMEYLPGLSLQDLVERHGPLPPGRVIHLLRQACDGLHEAHLAGLIHRDLKPANIFSAYRGARYDVAKVLDFGLVKPTREDDSPALTREGMVTGSPLYMSPEQVTRSHSPDARTDIYALGGIAYYLLTGRAPFAGSDAMAVMIANARDPAPPPSTVRSGIPADLEQVVLRCLEKNPANRFQDAQALARAFSGCQDSQSWSDERAEAWWLANEPGILESPMGPASSHPVVESAELSHAADRLSTIGASAVEAVAESFNSGAASLTPSLIEGDLDTERPR